MNENNSNEVKNTNENQNVSDRSGNKKEQKEAQIQYRKPSIFSSLLLILLGILISSITFVLLAVFVFKVDFSTPKENTPKTNNEVVENQDTNNEKVNLDITEDLIASLYKKIPVQLGSVEVYKGTVTTSKQIEDRFKMLFIIKAVVGENKYEEITDIASVADKLKYQVHPDPQYKIDALGNSVKKINYDIVKEEYKNVFGPNEEMPVLENVIDLGYSYEYYPADNCYYGHSFSGGGGGGYYYYSRLSNHETNSDKTEIYIYDDFIMLCSGFDSWSVLSTSDYANKTGLIEGNIKLSSDTDGHNMYNGKTEKQIQDYYFNSNNCGKFKHTFKLDTDGNYYWYSSEKIN